MKIDDIKTISISIPTIRRHTHALASYSSKDFVIVKVHTDTGIIGIGESMSSIYSSGETQESIKTTLDRYLKEILFGSDPFEIGKISEAFDRLIGRGNLFVKAAVDMAIFDIIGKKLGIPIYQLFGGKLRSRIDLSWSLGSQDPDTEIKEAQELIDKGLRIFKVKAGVLSPSEDVKRVKAIRDAVGDDIGLRVDVNQAWRSKRAIRTLKEMERYDLDFVEQPVPWWDLDGMASVAKAIDTPLMADESLFTPHDAVEIIKRHAADVFSLKVTKCGGLLDSRKIAAIAEAAGIGCYIGSNLETGVGTAAAAHLAVSIRNLVYGCELFGPLLLQKDILKKPVQIENGSIYVSERPGLGIQVHEEKIQSLRTRQGI